jgi:hypothetical protein
MDSTDGYMLTKSLTSSLSTQSKLIFNARKIEQGDVLIQVHEKVQGQTPVFKYASVLDATAASRLIHDMTLNSSLSLIRNYEFASMLQLNKQDDVTLKFINISELNSMWYAYDNSYNGIDLFHVTSFIKTLTITPQTSLQEYKETLHPTPPANWSNVTIESEPMTFAINDVLRVKTFTVNDWVYINIAKNDDPTFGRLFRVNVPNALFINFMTPGVSIERTSTNSSFPFVEDIFFYRINTGAESPLALEGLTNMTDIGDIAVKSLNTSNDMMQLIFT